ncbi:MAG: 5-formyltetrahydrofolate cyclo-ligase [Deltaproteobacteria bacterium]|jgi:5-formyltetrahydrofolate cyclo-ligase|nr:5-formyltetrahydrofolate cyclo-ligase [Deltaproteobacteria bacterium]
MKPGKSEIRSKIIKERDALEATAAERRSRLAQERLLAEPAWKNAGFITLYVAAKGEIQTGRLLEAAWAAGKRVFLPRVDKKERGLMHFLRCSGREQLGPGSFGLLEPLEELCPACDFAREGYPDLMILPGLAFDRRGGRLGWGGGYYDRFLEMCAAAAAPTRFIGLGYTFQLLPEVPVEPWDRPVDAVCTDEEFIWIK